MTALSVVQVHHHLTSQASRTRELSQHAPRPARVRLMVRSQGVGETRLLGRRRIEFGALMLEEPSFSWGVVAAQPLKLGDMPLCTAIVLSYVINQSGLYTAAEMGFRVDSDDIHVRLKFSLTFEASSMRSSAGTGIAGATVASNASSTIFRQYV